MEAEEDERMDESPPPSDEEEGEGVMSEDSRDSSEESEEDDPEEAKRIAEGFIVDDSRERSRKHKKQKKKHRKHREKGSTAGSDGGKLDEDDLDLLEQNTGRRFDRPDGSRKLFRKGGRADDSPGDDRRGPQRLEMLFGQDAVRRFDQEDDDLADFIEEDEDEEPGQNRERARATKGPARPARNGFSRAAAGLSQEAWEEIQVIFGSGNDYDWAMELDEAAPKGDLKLEDIYEPSQIAERMMTQADEEIRVLDKPERLQLATASLMTAREGQPIEALLAPIIPQEYLEAATDWVAPRISQNLSASFLVTFEGGIQHPLRHVFMRAVNTALREICCNLLEPPFVWLHRRDYFVHFDPSNPNPQLQYCDLLGRTHLWTIQTLGIKYRALIDRKAALRSTWTALLEEPDPAFEDAFDSLESVEEVADLSEWVNMRYASQINRLKEVQREEEGALVNGAQKRAIRESKYSRIRNSDAYKLAQAFGAPPYAIGRDYAEGVRRHFVDDPRDEPELWASHFVDPTVPFLATAEAILESAKFAIVQELAGLVPLRKAVRRMFRDYGLVTVRPTNQGISKIDNLHPYYTFKYMTNKPVRELRQSANFVYMLDAEKNGDVTVTLALSDKERNDFLNDLSKVYLSDFSSSTAQAWNELRTELLQTAVDQHLIPFGARWLRETLLEEVQEYVARRCGEELMKRVDVAPYRARSTGEGERSSVVAISHGHGDPKKDSVWAVYLDEDGRVREHLNVDNLRPTNPRNPQGDEYRERLCDLLIRRKPQIIVLGGFTPTTHRLQQDVKQIVESSVPKITQEIKDDKDEDGDRIYATEAAAAAAAAIEVIFVNDEVARIYQHSARAQTEFSELSTIGKYCVALARYVQNPVNEYAALGNDLSALSFDPAQKFISSTLLATHLERAIVNSVNTCGVDINRAVREPYHALLLPYIAGLGPRKAAHMIRLINAHGGTLPSRAALVTTQIMGNRVFMNCAAFLRIDHDDLPKKLIGTAGEDAPDILDSTRIHPEDYDIARKMAADAEELDEEDLADLTHPSQVVSKLLEDDPKKLDELSLDDFAVELQRLLGTPKRLTLYLIRDELKTPFKEQRTALAALDAPQIFSQLTGETRQTLELGLIIPVMVLRFIGDKKMLVRLDSGIEGSIEEGYMDYEEGIPISHKYQIGQTIQAVVTKISMTEFTVELDCRKVQLEQGDLSYRQVARDAFWAEKEEQADLSRIEVANKKRVNRSYRTIQHPYFHNYNSRQAEEFLHAQPNGECVIRPSSKGPDHLAVTWKVAEDLFQHLDVLELDKPSEFELGTKLRVNLNRAYEYSDLDELVVSHIKSMARKVEEMVHHDKFKGNEAETREYLKTQQRANPHASLYAFALDHKKAGQFVLMFLTNKSTEPSTCPVRIGPGYFQLYEVDCPDIISLCNAFKTQYVNAVTTGASNRFNPSGGRTPGYGAAANAGAYNYGQAYGAPQMGGYNNFGQAPPFQQQPIYGNQPYAANAPYR